MGRDSKYDILFEPIQIGPVIAKNRFYQVPQCNGLGMRFPSAMAAMRGMKAEGGWAVVSTEACDFHPKADKTPNVLAQLWDAKDVITMRRMTKHVHSFGSLAACELAFQGGTTSNGSRELSWAPSPMTVTNGEKQQSQVMDKNDIRNFRRWHREAAIRAKQAGFDIIYVYAGHNAHILQHFISRRFNKRTDEYGGSIENRTRLLREVIEDTKDAVGDTCAIAVRFAVDELIGPAGITADGDGRAVVEILADLPDLWDVNLSDWSNDSQTARFAEEGYQESFIGFVKTITSKPVVGVGRYTTPDAMVSAIKRNVLDFIGAARPSIADPFLPKKIQEGRLEDICECIGCNICVASDHLHIPIRCTQNPTQGEEWRRGWHPERVPCSTSNESILIVGAGPAGLEAARVLGKRGYDVTLAEAGKELGGRIAFDRRLPGLASWGRVADFRIGQIGAMQNVQLFLDNRLSSSDIRGLDFNHVVVATGSVWRRDGIGQHHHSPIPGSDARHVFTADDLNQELKLQGPVLIYDDDHYYMASVQAERLRDQGLDVIYVTPEVEVARWTRNTMEQFRIQSRLLQLGIQVITSRKLSQIGDSSMLLSCVYTDDIERVSAGSVVLVTSRLVVDDVYQELTADPSKLTQSGISSVDRIGDCRAPATVAEAVYAGHRYAREFQIECDSADLPYRREVVELSVDWPIVSGSVS